MPVDRALDTSDYDEVLAGLRRFLESEVIARHEEAGPLLHDPRHIYGTDARYQPHVLEAISEVRQASARAGYYAMLVPEEFGGGGLGYEALFRAWEQVFYTCSSRFFLGFWSIAHWARGPSRLVRHFDPSLRDRVLPDLLAGHTSLCFAMSEPDAGSDAWMMSTTAERTTDGYVLNGTKQWITNSPYADAAIVFAVTDRAAAAQRRGGISAFYVPTSTPGFRIDSVLQMFGHNGGDEGIVSLHDVHVPHDHLIGDEGSGFTIALEGVSTGRLYNTGRSVGLARWATELALAYAEERRTFGRPIIENQAVSFPLAESVMDIHAARLMGLDCARRLDRGESAKLELSMCKAFATEAAARAIDRAVQVHGGMGFTNEIGLAEAWQHARRICVADGSAEILRRTIVQLIRPGRSATAD